MGGGDFHFCIPSCYKQASAAACLEYDMVSRTEVHGVDHGTQLEREVKQWLNHWNTMTEAPRRRSRSRGGTNVRGGAHPLYQDVKALRTLRARSTRVPERRSSGSTGPACYLSTTRVSRSR